MISMDLFKTLSLGPFHLSPPQIQCIVEPLTHENMQLTSDADKTSTS